MATQYRLVVPFLAAALLVGATMPGASQSSDPRPHRDRYASLLAHVDTDHDGAISAAEAEAFAAARFDRLDTGHKGYVTLADFESRQRRAVERASEQRRAAAERSLLRVEAAFKDLNKTGDGHLTKAEYLADSRARFAAADTDKNGKLSLDELRGAKGHAF